MEQYYTAGIKVGQEIVVVREQGHENYYIFGYKVAKVTAAGQVTVQCDNKELRFSAKGIEIGGSYRKARLEKDVAAVRKLIARMENKKVAALLITAVRVEKCLPTYTKDSMLEQIATLEKLLAAAKEAVEKI